MPYNSFDDCPMSWRPALTRGEEPLHLALARLLEEDIRSGALRPGTRLPPQRELADFLDISVSTVTRAFAVCSRRGLLSLSLIHIWSPMCRCSFAGEWSPIPAGSPAYSPLSATSFISLNSSQR